MGFNEVYRSLQELFPQIDARALRAVSIEHSKDVDAAVEAVLEEIIPFFTEKSRPSSPLTRSISLGQMAEEAVSATQSVDSAEVISMKSVNDGNNQFFHDANNGNNEPVYDTCNGQHEGKSITADLTLSENFVEPSINISSANVHSNGETVTLTDENRVNIRQTEVSLERKGPISAGKCPEQGIETLSDICHTLGTLGDVDMGVNQTMNLVQKNEGCDAQTIDNEGNQGNSSAHQNNSVGERASMTVQTLMSPSESSVQLVVLPNVNINNSENLKASFPCDAMETTTDIIGTEDECTMNDTMTQSGQINIMDVIEDIIADAKNHKKTLFSAMESVIRLMREVELREQAAEQAKEESTNRADNVLNKVEELKQILKHAKEANDMHAGEVYGERAILATELRELQARVIFLSDERDKSLAVLDEMQQTLEFRLATAENEIKRAEQEKLRNQESARKALADQEIIMESVVQESNILKQATEENAKLREFLMDRGRVVDMLQGEIAVICQDVKLLKKKLDERVPLRKSLSFSQTSFMLASSGSSVKSLIPDQVEPVPSQDDSIKSKQNMDQLAQVFVDEAASYDRKALLDEGWDFFDNFEK